MVGARRAKPRRSTRVPDQARLQRRALRGSCRRGRESLDISQPRYISRVISPTIPSSDADVLERALHERFGLASFRPGQREASLAVLEGRDLVAVMPTGAGKSLCFQLPALLLDGPTVVVSPLIALMKDQVDALRARGMAAAALHSGMSVAERQAAEAALGAGRRRSV